MENLRIIMLYMLHIYPVFSDTQVLQYHQFISPFDFNSAFLLSPDNSQNVATAFSKQFEEID